MQHSKNQFSAAGHDPLSHCFSDIFSSPMPPATEFGRHGGINPLAQDIKIIYPILSSFIENIKSGEAPMRQLTIAAATVAMAAFISAAPALADRHDGGPIKQNGQ